MKIVISSVALAAALAVSPLAVGAASAGEVGLLGCSSDGNTGFIIGSSEDLVCDFTPADGGPVERYKATLDTFGLDVGVTGRTVMSWAVVAAGDGGYQPSALAGTYVGASADASAVVGGGANILVGGADNSYSLQPVSVQAQEGINAAIGVTKFTLEAVAPQPVVIEKRTTIIQQ